MILHQMFVKMLGREALVALPIQSLDLLLAVERNPLAGRLAEPPVQKARLAVILEARPPAPERPLADAKQVRRFQLIELRRLVAAQNVQKPQHTNTLKGF